MKDLDATEERLADLVDDWKEARGEHEEFQADYEKKLDEWARTARPRASRKSPRSRRSPRRKKGRIGRGRRDPRTRSSRQTRAKARTTGTATDA